MNKEYICNLYNHNCECCPYEIDQKDEEGNIVLDCSYEYEQEIEKWLKTKWKTKSVLHLKTQYCNKDLIITLKGIAELEKENGQLKRQIEQMKCCENCRYYSRTYGHCYSYQNCKFLSNWVSDKWQIKN